MVVLKTTSQNERSVSAIFYHMNEKLQEEADNWNETKFSDL
jgi:hypothetical protein